MQRPSALDVLFWSLAVLSALALTMLVLVLAGAVPIGSASEPAATADAIDLEPESTTTLTTPATTKPGPRGTTAAPTRTAPVPVPPTAAKRAVVVVTATRGDSWISARAGSETGTILEERLLAQGESIRLEGRRVWLSLGAAGNVDLTVDGEPRTLGTGTVSGVLTPAKAAGATS